MKTMQTIGERLEEARKRKGYSIREASDATKIRGDYLHKFENNQYDIRLPEIYVRGFLRTYATYLGLPADKIINDYKALGLGREKQGRGFSREVYGRMDLSISGPRHTSEGNGENASASEEGDTTESPSFKPGLMLRISSDKRLLIKMGGIIAGLLLIGIFVIWGLSSTSSADEEEQLVWVQPGANEDIIGLLAISLPANVQVTTTTGEILYRGALKKGEVRIIPRRGRLTIYTENPENIRIEVDGRQVEIKNPATGEYLKSATINPRR